MSTLELIKKSTEKISKIQICRKQSLAKLAELFNTKYVPRGRHTIRQSDPTIQSGNRSLPSTPKCGMLVFSTNYNHLQN